MEVLVVLAIVALLTVLTVPTYSRYIETSRARSAWKILKNIRNGERMFKLESGNFLAISEGDAPTADSQWNKIQMDNPNKAQASIGYLCWVDVAGGTFLGRARRTANLFNGVYTINEEGQVQITEGGLPPVGY
jgi:Tfp pilus assembly major pilin PilA